MDLAEHHAIGPRLWSTAQVVTRAFDRVLAEAGGSRPAWFVLMALHEEPPPSTQRELADRIDLTEATLTHHLHAMESAGLVRRVRGTENRRIVRVEETASGRALYRRLLRAALAFDRELAHGLGTDVRAFLEALDALRTAIAGDERVPPPV